MEISAIGSKESKLLSESPWVHARKTDMYMYLQASIMQTLFATV